MPSITIPLNKYTNIHTQNNSGFVETAKNVLHDKSGYTLHPALNELTSFDAISGSAPYVFVTGIGVRATSGAGASDYYNYIYYYNDTYMKFHKHSIAGDLDEINSNNYSPGSVDNGDFVEYGSKVLFASRSDGMYDMDAFNGSFSGTAITGSENGATTCVVKGFVLTANIYDGTYRTNRIVTSSADDYTSWSGNFASTIDLPDVGIIIRMIGGEWATIIGSKAIAIMQFVGGDTIWQIDIIEESKGLIAPYGIVKVDNDIYYASNTGLYLFTPNGSVKLAKDTYDPNYSKNYFATNNYVSSAYDSDTDCVYWTIQDENKAVTESTTYCYNRQSDQVTEIEPHFGADNAYILYYNVYTAYAKENGDTDAAYRRKAMVIGNYKNGATYKLKAYYFDSANYMIPEIKTGFYELAPGSWATIKRIIPIDSSTVSTVITQESTAADIDIEAYDENKTLIDTVNIATYDAARIRQTGRYFKFNYKSTVTRVEGLEVEFEVRGSR